MADLGTLNQLKRPLARARAKLTRPRRWRSFGPVVLWTAAFLSLVLLGVIERLPLLWQTVATTVFLIGFAGLAVRGWFGYRAPTDAETLDYLDRSHPTRPISSLSDRPSQADREAYQVWSTHQSRLVGLVHQIKPPSLKSVWRKVDPAGLRALAPVLLLVALIAAGPQAGPRLLAAFTPDIGQLMGGNNLTVTAWVTPPAYTGRPPLYLESGDDRYNVPQGSEITVRVNARSAPTLVLKSEDGTERIRLSRAPDDSFEVKTTLSETVEASVDWWGARGIWSFDVAPDTAPIVAFISEPTIGENDSTTFSWSATDDFGISSLELEIQPTTPHPAAPGATDRIDVPMPDIFPTAASDTPSLDTTRNKWAGLEVQATLVATDAAGQVGRSDTTIFTLPEKLFLQPLAKAAQEIRVDVLRDPRPFAFETKGQAETVRLAAAMTNRLEAAPEGVQLAALKLDALTYQPERFIPDRSVFLGLRRAHGILSASTSKADADGVDTVLWSVALKAEYGNVADASAALMAAKKALEQALRDGASEDVIRRLMENFREAAENYIAAKMAEAFNNGPSDTPDMSDEMAQSLGGDDLEDMLNTLEDLTETGARDAARQLLSDVTNLLNNLEFQMNQNGEGGSMPMGENEENVPEGEQALQGALDRLSEILSEQRELNDETLRQGQGQDPMQGDQPPGETGDGENQGRGQRGGISGDGDMSMSLAERQQQLAEEFQQFADDMRDRGGQVGSLSDDQTQSIENAQRRAGRALERGDDEVAQWSQQRAVQELRDAASELARELDAQRAARMGQAGQPNERDPLGRPLANGSNDGDSVTVPDQLDRQRARDILDELRRRLGVSEDEFEEEYLERLLDRF